MTGINKVVDSNEVIRLSKVAIPRQRNHLQIHVPLIKKLDAEDLGSSDDNERLEICKGLRSFGVD